MRLKDVARWPAKELDVIDEYLRKQPAAEERVEFAIANFHAQYVNAHLKDGTPPTPVTTFLPFLDPWKKQEVDARYSDSDKSFLQALGGFKT